MNLKASEVACVNLVTSLKAFVFISSNDAQASFWSTPIVDTFSTNHKNVVWYVFCQKPRCCTHSRKLWWRPSKIQAYLQIWRPSVTGTAVSQSRWRTGKFKKQFFLAPKHGGRRILYYFGFEINSKEPEDLSKCAQNSIVRFRAYMKSKFLFDGE